MIASRAQVRGVPGRPGLRPVLGWVLGHVPRRAFIPLKFEKLREPGHTRDSVTGKKATGIHGDTRITRETWAHGRG